MRGPATDKDRLRVTFFFLLIALVEAVATTIQVTMCIDFLTLNKMASERSPLLQRRYGKATVPPAAATATLEADAPVAATSTRPQYQNIPITFPRNISTGEPVIEKPYNIYIASLKEGNSNLNEVKKTKIDAYQKLIDDTFYIINEYNQLYNKPLLESLSSHEIKDVITSKLQSLEEEIDNIRGRLRDLRQRRDELRRLKKQSPSIYSVEYERAKKIYKKAIVQEGHIEYIGKILQEIYDDLIKLNSNLNIIRQVKQSRRITTPAAARPTHLNAAGTGLVLPAAAAGAGGAAAPAAAAAASNANNSNSNNSLPFPLEGGKKLRSRKQTKRNRKTKRRHK